MGWVLPTSHNDPDGKWVYESNAYNNNTSDHAITTPAVEPYSWSSFLDLIRASTPCNKLRFYCLTYDYPLGSIDIDAYYGGTWNHVYQGTYTKCVWVEKSLGATYDVTKLRIRLYNPYSFVRDVAIREAHFYYYEAPTVTTQAVSSVDHEKGTGNGNITVVGSSTPTKRGFCWNTSGSPTVADDKVEENGSFSTGAFTGAITGLDPGVKYYVKAYAYNEAGYAYGGEVNFTTDKVAPTVTTQDPTSILPTTATGNGNITALGGENATVRGFKYGLTKDDTWSASDSGSFSAGAYTKGLTGLSANTNYWIRAFATNNIGTSYGAWVEFQTAAAGVIPTGTLIVICSDYTGYTYKVQRSETHDGEAYIAYFVFSTDLSNKQALAVYKRILDLHLYFKSEDSGTAEIYVKRDSEANWHYVGSVALTGTADIIVKHLATRLYAKHFLFKVQAANANRFLGCLFEFIPGGMR